MITLCCKEKHKIKIFEIRLGCGGLNMIQKNNRDIYFPKNLSNEATFNHFIISLITYDRVCIDDYTFITSILNITPKKYHQLLIQSPALDLRGVFFKEPLDNFYGEMKPHFMHKFNYSKQEFEIMVNSLKARITQFKRVTDPNLMQSLLRNGAEGHFLDIHDAVRIANCQYYSAIDLDFFKMGESEMLNLNFDKGQSTKIFEINRLPNLSDVYQTADFNLEKFLGLREKKGLELLRELIFREKNFENPEELVMEYNDMLSNQGVYKNKLEKPFWAISNALSVGGVFSPDLRLSIMITLTSLITGNHKLIIKNPADKLSNFIKHELRPFIDSINK